jgi:hypothetical protein
VQTRPGHEAQALHGRVSCAFESEMLGKTQGGGWLGAGDAAGAGSAPHRNRPHTPQRVRARSPSAPYWRGALQPEVTRLRRVSPVSIPFEEAQRHRDVHRDGVGERRFVHEHPWRVVRETPAPFRAGC